MKYSRVKRMMTILVAALLFCTEICGAFVCCARKASADETEVQIPKPKTIFLQMLLMMNIINIYTNERPKRMP